MKEVAIGLGASAFGVCEVGDLIDRIHPEIRLRTAKLPYAISIGIAVQKAVLETLIDRPNEIYKAHYRAINSRLDDITLRLAQAISDRGGHAIPIPASKVIKRYPMIGHVSHREFACKAGLGWRGKNNLLIHPVYGGRIRLATLLTNLKLKSDAISGYECGECHACARHCPAGAIGDAPEDFNLEKCRDRVIAFSREANFGHHICGLCLNCCPGINNGKK